MKCFGTPGFLSENTKYLQVRFTGVHFWLEWCLGCFDMFLPFPENLPFSPAAVQNSEILLQKHVGAKFFFLISRNKADLK